MKKILLYIAFALMGTIAQAQMPGVDIRLGASGAGSDTRYSDDNMVADFHPTFAQKPLKLYDWCFDRRRGGLYFWNGVSWQRVGINHGELAVTAYTVTNPASNFVTGWDATTHNLNTVNLITSGVDTMYWDSITVSAQVPGTTYVIDMNTTSRTGDADTLLLHFHRMFKTYDGQPLTEWKCPPRGRIQMAFRYHVSVEGATLVAIDDILGSYGHTVGSTSGITTVFANYDSLMSYTGTSTVAVVKDFTSTTEWTVKGGVFYQVSAFIGKTYSQAVDYATRFTDGSGRKWQRDFDGINFQPEFWRVDSTLAYAGTAGWYADGSEAMYQLQSSAANYYFYDAVTGLTEVGETINLTPGKTYESTVQVPMHPYLKINGNGSTIVRKDPETTTTADTTLASTAFVIVPAGGTTGFRPNMIISVQRAGDALGGLGENENTGFRAVTSFGRANAGNNDTIFVLTNWTRGATSGSTVYSGVHSIFITSGNNRDAGATIKNLNIDGNKSANSYSLSWLSGWTFQMPTAKNNLIEGCFFKDVHCENIEIAGGEVRNCSFRDLEGTFSHQSALDTFSLLFQNIRGDSVCLAGTTSGHAGACFETSVGAFGSVTIRDCHVTNGQTKLIGNYSNDDANIYVDNVTAMNFNEIFSSNGKLGSFRLTNSQLVNCGDLYLKATGAGDTIAYVSISKTFFTNTRFEFVKITTLNFSGNTVSWRPAKFTGYTAGIESAYTSAIAIVNPLSDIEINNNYFWGDSTYNSFIGSLLYLSPSTTTIAGKTVYRGTMTFRGNKVFNFGRLSANSLTSDYDYAGWEFSDNELWSNPASAQYAGTAGMLNLTRGQKFLRNRVVNQTPAATTYMVTAYGILSTSIDTTTSMGAVMNFNTFEGKGCTYILGSGSWPYNCFGKGNVTRAAPIISTKSASVDNTVVNSTLLPALTAPSTITRVPYRRPTEPYIKIIR